jgi:hypothetical protein
MGKISKKNIKRNRLSKKKLNAGAPGTRNPKLIDDDDPVCPAIYPQCCRAWTESARCILRNRSCTRTLAEYRLQNNDNPHSKKTITRERDVPHGDVCPAGISTKPTPKSTRKPIAIVEEEEEKPKPTRKPRGKPRDDECQENGWGCSVQGGFNLY